MNTFDFYEIVFAILSATVFGAVFGGLYKSFSSILLMCACFFKRIPSLIFVSSPSELSSPLTSRKKSGLLQNTFDFLFFSVFGFLYIILVYLALDGVFRLYMLCFSLFGFFISKRTLGSLLERIILAGLFYLFKILFFAIYVLLLPIKHTIIFIKKLLMPPLNSFRRIIAMRRSQKIFNRKIKEISEIKYYFDV